METIGMQLMENSDAAILTGFLPLKTKLYKYGQHTL